MESGETHGENLIFLISQPRAGSTMLQKILGSHSAVHTVSEPWIALHPLFGLRPRGIATDYGSRLGLTGVLEFLDRLPEGEQAYWEGVRRMLGHLYGRAIEQSGKRFFLDKTPRYYFILSELRRVFPRARFVFLLRNPLAVLASILDIWVPNDFPDVLRRYRHDLAVAPRCIDAAIRESAGDCVVVHYEDITADPEPSISRVCEYIGVSFEPAMIDYGNGAAGKVQFRYGDTRTVDREVRPVSEYSCLWKGRFTTPIRKMWARGYIDSLGAQTLSSLGYDYDELARAFPPQLGSDDAWEYIVRPSSSLRTARASAPL